MARDERYSTAPARGLALRLRALAAPLVVVAMGLAVFAVASSQPAFVGARIGPGLFAQIFGSGVVVLSCVWASIALMAGPARIATDRRRVALTPGVALLAAVASFILLRPLIGLVPTCIVVGLLASFGAGDRSMKALAASAGAAGLVGWTIGLLLLPPTTALWPWSPHL